ncbi:DUF2079 domain-containing protein [Litorilinea aerophila]|uniref:DUF2079 domain-containing protein n=1 Tax=Litorilinea aerophila TaxID=1204385 RepID=A0A540V903_9CHLR|nr:DUF2079 domain-containing protein [Litorilinea aerophila]MCC9078825.1 DUF2079 domain-containing protein [Litorilinea aerophila]
MAAVSLARLLRKLLDALDIYRAALVMGVLLYVWIFTHLAWAQHAGLRTHKADLGQIDQAVWNSSRGRFVESTDYGFIASRLTDHVEPILALISPIYWVWDDVRALLLLQVLFVAVGAWPVYELALRQLDALLSPDRGARIWHLEPLRRLTRPLALSLAMAYLLAPQLQSAVLTEFHAAPLAAPFILWAFWAVERGRWYQFVLAALLVASVKEEMALLAAGLGAWAVWRLLLRRWSGAAARGTTVSWIALASALGVMVLSLAWFYLATFVIVPAHAATVYGVAASSYFQRYGALGDSPADILRSFFTRPELVWQIATEPARLAYLRGLLAPFGFLALLAPEILLLSAPLLLANLLSAYPAQYYGEFHYSAPLVPYVAVAAAYGLGRLWRILGRRLDRRSADFQHLPAASPLVMALMAFWRNSRLTLRPLLATLLCLWILGWALATYGQAGRGPLGGRYDPTPITTHARLLSRFLAQIPADAAVTATAAVHPHLSHRRFVYQFPIGLEPPSPEGSRAEWALLDVTTATDMAPGDVKARVEAMLAGEWGVVDGADGYLLLRKGDPDKQIPNAFYDFARAPRPSGDLPLDTSRLTLVSVAARDWPRWRQTTLELRWYVGPDFDPAAWPDLPQLEVWTPAGDRVYTLSDALPPALVWYPPDRWRPGETVRVTTLPLYLPRSWGVVIPPSEAVAIVPSLALAQSTEGTLVAAYRRMPGEGLVGLSKAEVESEAPEALLATLFGEPQAADSVTFQAGDGRLQAWAWLEEGPVWPGRDIHLWIQWRGQRWPDGYTVFVHVRRAGETVAQADGPPRLVVPLAAAELLPRQGFLHDWRAVPLPAHVQAGERLQVVVGLYDPVQGGRAMLALPDGQRVDAWVVGEIQVEAPPMPDQACALIPATCASQ